jgi:hypothetical protein
MTIQEQIKLRFEQLAEQTQKIPMPPGYPILPDESIAPFYAWASSALNVIQGVFGKDSSHYQHLETELVFISGNTLSLSRLEACRGIFLGAKSDVDGGYIFNLQALLPSTLYAVRKF